MGEGRVWSSRDNLGFSFFVGGGKDKERAGMIGDLGVCVGNNEFRC